MGAVQAERFLVSRRGFLGRSAGLVGVVAGEPARQMPVRSPLRVRPVLTYSIPKRRPATSWRSWGGIQSEQDAERERTQIQRELEQMKAAADFPLDLLPLESASTVEAAAALAKGPQEVTLMYGAGGGQNVLEALTAPNRWNLLFLRHRTGQAYLWYEIADPRFLRKGLDERTQPGIGVEDIVVDSHADIAVRLRGLYGLKNTFGKRIVAVGGPSGWSAGGKQAPQISRDLWKLDIRTVPYPALGERIKKARQDAGVVKRANDAAEKYLKDKTVRLETRKDFFTNAFLLTEVFRDLLDEAATDAITINQCMGTIMPLAETSACMPLSILNDEGYMAFCESDFVVIPSGILLHYISGKPVFLNDPTHPHGGLVTMAHCTSPRKLDGVRAEPVRVLTHFESDYGAAPKVEMKLGQTMTVIDPDFASRRWLGFEAEVVGNPFLHICRSQVDVRIKGDCDKLVEQMRGFHWMASYGNYLGEVGYALKKASVGWLQV